MKNVVTQHQRPGLVGHKVTPDDEGQRQADGRKAAPRIECSYPTGCHRPAVRQSAACLIHQRAQGVIDHGLVIHRHQLLANGLRDRVKPGAGTPGQDDAFALSHVGLSLLFRLL